MPFFEVKQDLCVKCGACFKVCPLGVVAWQDGEFPMERKGFGERCIACGQCIAFCPTGACLAAKTEQLEPGVEPAVFARNGLPGSDAADLLIKTRRSVRAYKESPVPRETIDALIQTARYAPTASNCRDVSWIAVYEREKLIVLGDLLADWLDELQVKRPPFAAAMHADALAKRWRKGHDVFFRGAPHMVLAISPLPRWGFLDAAIAATTLELLAHGHGLGACWAGYFMTGAAESPQIRQAIGLKEGDSIGGALMLGIPAIKQTRIPPRAAETVVWL